MMFRKKDGKNKNKPVVQDMLNLWELGMEADPTDILGSYTGTPNYDNQFELDEDDLIPEQDPDDL